MSTRTARSPRDTRRSRFVQFPVCPPLRSSVDGIWARYAEHVPAPFDIHPDIREASTLPARFYSDPEMLALCTRRILARSWQLVADTDSVKIPGQTCPVTLLEGLLDEPLLLTRDH